MVEVDVVERHFAVAAHAQVGLVAQFRQSLARLADDALCDFNAAHRVALVAEKDSIAAITEGDVEHTLSIHRLAEVQARVVRQEGAYHEFGGINPQAGSPGIELLVAMVNGWRWIDHVFP